MPRASVACRPGEAERGWFVAPRGVTKPSHEVPLGTLPRPRPPGKASSPCPQHGSAGRGACCQSQPLLGPGLPEITAPLRTCSGAGRPTHQGPSRRRAPTHPPHSPAWGASLPTQPWGLGGRQPTSRPDRGLDRAVGGPLPLAVATGSGLGTRSAASHRSDGFRDSSV